MVSSHFLALFFYKWNQRRSTTIYEYVTTSFTFAKGWWAVPLRRVARNTADNNLTNKFVALVTEETQSFSCLVAVLVQGLVTIVREARVWAWVIFYYSENTNTHTEDSYVFEFVINRQTKPAESRRWTYRHTLGCGHSIWGCQCLVHGRRFGWDLPVDSPGYKRNAPLFQLQNLLQGALSVLRLPPLLDQDTDGLRVTKDMCDSI